MTDDRFDEPAVDLSPLDPTRDRERWEARIEAIVDRAVAGRRRSPTLLGQLVAWSRPALAIAAAAVIAVWLKTSIPGGRQASSAGSGATQDTAAVFADWALGPPSESAWQAIARAGGRDDG